MPQIQEVDSCVGLCMVPQSRKTGTPPRPPFEHIGVTLLVSTPVTSPTFDASPFHADHWPDLCLLPAPHTLAQRASICQGSLGHLLLSLPPRLSLPHGSVRGPQRVTAEGLLPPTQQPSSESNHSLRLGTVLSVGSQ